MNKAEAEQAIWDRVRPLAETCLRRSATPELKEALSSAVTGALKDMSSQGLLPGYTLTGTVSITVEDNGYYVLNMPREFYYWFYDLEE